jgi:transcriptional regulator with PAS, ATPase and Fis domain
MTLEGLKGADPCMAYNVRCAERLLNKDVAILLLGETGTGKEAFARAIHEASHRASKPFVTVNCAAIPESLIESELFGYQHGAFTGARRQGMRGKILQASGGTLFLDEIGDMPLHLQTRLLRVLEEREVLPLGCETPIPVDLHVISATHRNLWELVARGEFREDLSPAEWHYPDPAGPAGAYRSGRPDPLHPGSGERRRRSALACAEREALLQALNSHRWNITGTAADLGISRNTLYRKMKKHGFSPPTLG